VSPWIEPLPTSGENPLRPCEFRPTSVAGEAADNLGQFKPITITDEVEKVEKTTQFEQSRINSAS
jgi:hypothetical protein